MVDKILFLLTLIASFANSENYAILTAGSKGFWNYRHQADTCHAYHTLRSHGIPPQNIIHLAFDDIANSSENPFQGQIFNKPDPQGNGFDVYKGCEIDYKGQDVTPDVFLAVLKGNTSAVQGKGNGRVLSSGADDNVFIYFSDHGGPGVITFPDFTSVFNKDLIEALQYMHSKKMFKQLVFYMEACESGSMFENILPSDIQVYAVTATNSTDYSYATYCDYESEVNGVHLVTCLGDLFSVSFLENLDDMKDESLSFQQQFEIVKNQTFKSPVKQWGDLSITDQKVSDFISGKKDFLKQKKQKQEKLPKTKKVSAYDVKLHYYYNQYILNPDKYIHLLLQEIQHRENIDYKFKRMASHIFQDDEVKALQSITVYQKPKNLDCYKEAVHYYRHHCETSEYVMKYMKFFNFVCNIDEMTIQGIQKAIDLSC